MRALGFLLLFVAALSSSLGQQESAEDLAPGMVDTGAFHKKAPWSLEWFGQDQSHPTYKMVSLHLRYGIEEKYKGLFSPGNAAAQHPDLLIRSGGSSVPSLEIRTTEDPITSVSRNPAKIGYLYARWMAIKLHGKGKVLLLMSGPAAEELLRGIAQAWAETPGMSLSTVLYAREKPGSLELSRSDADVEGIITDDGTLAIEAARFYLRFGEDVPPITSDDYNGWLRLAAEHKLEFLSVARGTALGLSCIDLTVRILRGQPVPQTAQYPLVTFEQDELEVYFRPDLDDDYYAVHELPEFWIKRHFTRKGSD